MPSRSPKQARMMAATKPARAPSEGARALLKRLRAWTAGNGYEIWDGDKAALEIDDFAAHRLSEYEAEVLALTQRIESPVMKVAVRDLNALGLIPSCAKILGKAIYDVAQERDEAKAEVHRLSTALLNPSEEVVEAVMRAICGAVGDDPEATGAVPFATERTDEIKTIGGLRLWGYRRAAIDALRAAAR